MFLELTENSNNRKFLANLTTVLRIEQTAAGLAIMQYQGSAVTCKETYLQVLALIKEKTAVKSAYTSFVL